MIRGTTGREHSETALTGYKIAYPMISADGARAAFTGMGAGREHVYLASDTAVCLNNSRHHVPHRMCRCGFYCFHTLAAARDLTCAPEHEGAVVLEVAASGRYQRHEIGLRYEHQRVRRVRTGRCRCGRGADVFVDGGTGRPGWRRLTPYCLHCASDRPVLTLTRFAALTGETGLTAIHDREPLRNFTIAHQYGSGTHRDTSAAAVADAEIAVLNARIDELHTNVDRLLHRD